ncbi:glutamate 5-kinase [Parvibaculum indicum]|uniref:glutamate 5-kinase n=1 Tax=Parvibaculum indicum TaxID=562969 RepID=UPI00141FDC7C|nr:glutamate 5-kinase [Parvibaculum indicum]NIJ41346.1 glutamate 5-kinase [Parvibaculum indicum]
MISRRLETAQRIVVKIGSSLLTESMTGKLNRKWLEALIDDLAAMRHAGQEVLIVSSGSIALGRHALNLPSGKLKLEESQAAAAVGQISLAHAYQEILSGHELSCAQILLTLSETEERRRYLNARSTMNTLLRMGAVPVVNENDTVATTEIRYGDNDRLAARVAAMISADLLVLLSDVDGLYTAQPGTPGADHIAEVPAVTPDIEAMAGDAASEFSRGGMKTKIAAARIATEGGSHMLIANGRAEHPLRALREGKARCTWFEAHATPRAARKRWISGTLKALGTLVIDDGAVAALERGRSLLPAGITRIEGEFDRGDAVSVCDGDGHEIAVGLSAYSSRDAREIIGHSSHEIEELLGYSGRAEMIHRDDLVLKRPGLPE